MRVLDVELPKSYRRPWKGSRPIIGVDTESLTNGHAFLACDSRGRHVWIRSFDDVIKFFDYVDYSYCMLVAFNMNFDASVLLKWAGKDFCTKLMNENHMPIPGGAVEYIPGKYLQFRFGNRFIRVFDVAQFFQGSLDWNAQQYLGMAKIKVGSKSFTEVDYDRKDLIVYCTKDAYLTQGLGEYVVEAFEKLNVNVRGLVSPANVLESYVLDQMGIRNVLDDIPQDALTYAIRAFDGAWFENFKAGNFKKTYRYDMVSAYPSIVRNLVDLSMGSWVHDKVRPRDALYGYVHAKLTIPRTHISPIVFRNTTDDGLQPYGSWDRCVNLCVLDWLKLHGGKAQIHDALWFVPGNTSYKYRGIVDKFFKVKKDAKADSMEKWSSKVALAGMYGKFLQHKKGVAGRLYNPIYATEITSQIRLAVADACMKSPESIVAVMSDCVTSTTPLDMPIGNDIGMWAPGKVGESLWIGPAQYEAEGQDSRFRRIEWRKMLSKDPEKVDYDVLRNGPLTLLQAVRLNKFEEVGIFNDVSITFNIRRLNWRRFWPIRPNCGGDLLANQYESKQICVSSRMRIEEMKLWGL